MKSLGSKGRQGKKEGGSEERAEARGGAMKDGRKVAQQGRERKLFIKEKGRNQRRKNIAIMKEIIVATRFTPDMSYVSNRCCMARAQEQRGWLLRLGRG